jgi:hypothetical protein
MSKYLPEFGWQPVILTPVNPTTDIQDADLVKDILPEVEVHKTAIREPVQYLNKIRSGKKVTYTNAVDSSGRGHTILNWIRANFFLPDPRIFWLRSAVNYAKRLIEEGDIDVLITTGPPHSMHLIGRGIKQKTGIKWVADFRDPWSEWKVLKDLGTSGIALAIHRLLEKKVLNSADRILVTSYHTAQEFQQKTTSEKVYTIYNGVDYVFRPKTQEPDKSYFELVYTGLLNEERNYQVLWQAISEYNKNASAGKKLIKVKMVGSFSENLAEQIKSVLGTQNFEAISAVPYHQALQLIEQADGLLLMNGRDKKSRAIVPAKTFEYLASGNPIMYFGFKNGEVAGLLAESSANVLIDYSADKEEIIRALNFLVSQPISAKAATQKGKEQFSRRHQTHKLSQLLDRLV